ncbi:hypothetical protein PO909_023408 [Leuciscus waleckii]
MLASIVKAVEFNAAEIKDCKSQVQTTGREVSVLKKNNEELRERVLELERYKRRWNLRIRGIKEKEGEDIRMVVTDLLVKISPSWSPNINHIVDTVHRVGRREENKTRHVIIQFTQRIHRDALWRMTKDLTMCKDLGIGFLEDYCKADRDLRAALWPKIQQARAAGKRAYYRGGAGYIDGQRITSAGLAILFCNSPGKVVTSRGSNNGHWLLCVLSIDGQYIFLINVYGYNNLVQNRQLISDVSDVMDGLKVFYPTANIIMGGDFNMVYDEWLDRYPPKCQYSSYNPTLSDFCRKHNVLDPWRIKHPDVEQYSWFKPNNTAKSRIDFWLISSSMINIVSDCCMSAAPLTDHSVIKLLLNPSGVRGNNKYWNWVLEI